MSIYGGMPEHLTPPWRAKSYLRDTAKHLAEAVWCLSMSLLSLWQHWRIATKRSIRLLRKNCLEWAVARRRKECVASVSPKDGSDGAAGAPNAHAERRDACGPSDRASR